METNTATENRPIAIIAPRAPLFDGKSLFYEITREQSVAQNGSNASLMTSGLTVHPHPLNMRNAIDLKDYSSHHSACIQAKVNCSVGLGFLSDADIQAANGTIDDTNAAQVASLLTGAPYVESDVDTKLDPLTLFGFAQALKEAIEDFEDTGNGYLEVARTGNDITWIGAIPSQYVHVATMKKKLFYRVRMPSDSGQDRFFSRFGMKNKEWLFTEGPYTGSTTINRDSVSEIIHFRQTTNRCQFYGYPSWLAGAISIDLLKKLQQYKADFLHNRGVLDYILAVTGGKVDDTVWDAIEDKINGTAGLGKNWKSLALNIPSPDADVKVHKLAADQKTEDQFAKDVETFAQLIVSAHRVPPLLANILIPGKLGATNEFMNALVAFQLLVVGPDQQIIQKTLASTLGRNEENGNLDLKPEDFRLRTITSQLNLNGIDTLSRMREEATSAGDRDLSDGVQE